MATVFKTSKGAKCVRGLKSETRSIYHPEVQGYIEHQQMQMLPVHPQRFEYIRADRLTATDEQA